MPQPGPSSPADPRSPADLNLHNLSEAEYRTLRTQCTQAKDRAYCPYSHFRVGAALLLEGGEVVSGANVENASYSVTTCAERVALCAAVGAGWWRRVDSEQGWEGLGRRARFRALAIAADTDSKGELGDEGFCSPCGMCRQALREFCDRSMPIFMHDVEGRCRVRTLGEMLPMAMDAVTLALGRSV